MQKIWFIEINGIREGPYSIRDLKRHKLVTPDTLVWKEGFTKWTKIRFVPELKDVFTDEHPPEKQKISPPITPTGKDELVLDLQRGFPPYLFWLIMALLLLSYFFYRAYDLP